jgi:hypothetical protein
VTRFQETGASRVVAWFSCGDASAVACRLAQKRYPQRDLVIARIVLTSEHEDNERFAADCSVWYGRYIATLRSTEYEDTWDVWQSRRYIAGIAGAPCTTALKKAVRFEFQRADDLHIFGYTIEEQKRADQFRKSNPELDVEFPLIDAHLTKADCHAIVRAAGIELPAMYRLGFGNNNCIGCPKGGAGYWNMIRRHFPEQFARMATLSRELGARLVKQDGARVFLDELRPETGRQQDEQPINCSPFCETTITELEAA